MKKLFFGVLVCSVFITLNMANAQDFRGSSWGDTKQNVIAVEDGKPAEKSQNSLIFMDSLGTVSVAAIYNFLDNGSLYKGSYMSLEKHINKNGHVDDYNRILAMLKTKYGEPALENQNWSNSLYKDDRENWGLAVGVGHLTFGSFWHLENTDITIILFGEQFKPHLVITFESKTLNEIAKKKAESAELEKL